jgi:hypothetical protein
MVGGRIGGGGSVDGGAPVVGGSRTGIVRAAVLFAVAGSASLPATVAVAVKRPVASGVTVSETVVEAPGLSGASEQVLREQLPSLVSPAVSVSSAGSDSPSLTPVAGHAPAFETTIVIVAAVPCTSGGAVKLCVTDRSAFGGTAFTVTVKLALTGLLRSSLSVAVQVTVVVPMGTVEPEAGVQTTVAPGSSSTAVGGV